LIWIALLERETLGIWAVTQENGLGPIVVGAKDVRTQSDTVVHLDITSQSIRIPFSTELLTKRSSLADRITISRGVRTHSENDGSLRVGEGGGAGYVLQPGI
jgi:hypothetical protein